MAEYVVGIDQSTQGTKALLFAADGSLIGRSDRPHRQIIDERGWVEHDPEEIFANTLEVVRMLVDKTGIDKRDIATIGISNQRETAMAWDKSAGTPIYNAIVWQCARGAQICARIEEDGSADLIHQHTGLRLSPYFSAAKLAWILENVDGARELAEAGNLCMGTMDSWLLYKLTGGRFETDYSNAARTQLFNIRDCAWDPEILDIFHIPSSTLAHVMPSDSNFGQTDLGGFLDTPIPIHAVLGDSNGALFGQGCLQKGMVKATYGTGSSVMMNIGAQLVFSRDVVTSIAWGMDGIVDYVLEGNINYSGAVITWLKDDMHLIETSAQTSDMAKAANPDDTTYLVPAFSGLGAPYWDSDARAVACGMTRTTGRNEFAKAALESIAFQINAVVETMETESGIPIGQLRADGGPTHNDYLMHFQADILAKPVLVAATEELSGLGAAYLAGLASGIYDRNSLFAQAGHTTVSPSMAPNLRQQRLDGWNAAIRKAMN